MINWSKIKKEDALIINKIIKRAVQVMKIRDCMSLEMDIKATHLSCPLKLEELLKADDFNFCHDVGGIMYHIDRETGTLKDCFFPRFAV